MWKKKAEMTDYFTKMQFIHLLALKIHLLYVFLF